MGDYVNPPLNPPVSAHVAPGVTENYVQPGEQIDGQGRYGFVNGRPRGDVVQKTRQETGRVWKFFPAQRARLAAATRRALGG